MTHSCGASCDAIQLASSFVCVCVYLANATQACVHLVLATDLLGCIFGFVLAPACRGACQSMCTIALRLICNELVRTCSNCKAKLLCILHRRSICSRAATKLLAGTGATCGMSARAPRHATQDKHGVIEALGAQSAPPLQQHECLGRGHFSRLPLLPSSQSSA